MFGKICWQIFVVDVVVILVWRLFSKLRFEEKIFVKNFVRIFCEVFLSDYLVIFSFCCHVHVKV